MLLGGEAIFGVMVCAGELDAAKRRAEQMAARAEQLGLRSRLYTAPYAALGIASRKSPCSFMSESELTGMKAIAAGRVVNRVQHDATLADDRDSFYASIAGLCKDRGTNFLNELDGTFALALWNEADRRLTLTTDPHGDGQLYYRVEPGEVCFSSSLRLLAEPGEDLNRDAIVEFLRFLYIAPPKTIYRGVRRLEPGHFVVADPAGVVVGAYSKTESTNDFRTSYHDGDGVLDMFQERFEAAIGRRVGQRRVGVLLSSGVDSATLMAACERTNPGQVQAYTVGFDEPDLDEAGAARALANQLGVPHRELKFNLSHYRAAFDRVARGFEQPFGDPAGLALTLACDAVQGHVDLLCDGTGSDGLFSSPIPRHLRFSLDVSARLPRPLRKSVAMLLTRGGVGRFSRHSTLFDFEEPEELFVTWAGWSKGELSALMGEPVSFADSRFYRVFRAHRGLGAQKVYDSIAVFPPDDSRFEAAAVADIPLELPYHDVDLCALIYGLPEEFRFHKGETKVLLRRLFARYFSPNVRAAKKRYFNVPVQSILTGSNYEILNEYLTPDVLTRHNIVDRDQARRCVDRYVSGDESLRFKVWALAVLHAWLNER